MRIEFKNGSVIETRDDLPESERFRSWEPNGPGTNMYIDPHCLDAEPPMKNTHDVMRESRDGRNWLWTMFR